MAIEGENNLGTVGPWSFLHVAGLVVLCTLDVPPWSGATGGDPYVCPVRLVGSSVVAAELRPDVPLFRIGTEVREGDELCPAVCRCSPLIPDQERAKESSAAGVYALRLGMTTDSEGTTRCVALILGSAVMQAESFERLGLVDDSPSDFFSEAEEVELKIFYISGTQKISEPPTLDAPQRAPPVATATTPSFWPQLLAKSP